MKTLDWYFDFISPYAYLQSERLQDLPDHVEIHYHPVLFPGLLKHWGTKGPAELASKRRLMHRQVLWLARHHNIALRIPPSHPFYPLPVLRLAIALNNSPTVIHTIFRFIWAEGHRPDEPKSWIELTQRLGISEPEELIQQAAVKDTLRENTESAIAQGVFGVPTAIADGHLFWGFDTTQMLLDYLDNPDLFNDEEMRRVSDLPPGTQRS